MELVRVAQYQSARQQSIHCTTRREANAPGFHSLSSFIVGIRISPILSHHGLFDRMKTLALIPNKSNGVHILL